MYETGHGVLWIYRVAEHFGLERFSILGHSWSCFIGSCFAASYPDRVNILVTFDRLKTALGQPEDYVKVNQIRTKVIADYWNKRNQKSTTMTYEEAKALHLKRKYQRSHKVRIFNVHLKVTRTNNMRFPGIFDCRLNRPTSSFKGAS